MSPARAMVRACIHVGAHIRGASVHTCVSEELQRAAARRCNSGPVGGLVISCFIFILSSAYYERGVPRWLLAALVCTDSWNALD